jgi:hypothetical protein
MAQAVHAGKKGLELQRARGPRVGVKIAGQMDNADAELKPARGFGGFGGVGGVGGKKAAEVVRLAEPRCVRAFPGSRFIG